MQIQSHTHNSDAILCVLLWMNCSFFPFSIFQYNLIVCGKHWLIQLNDVFKLNILNRLHQSSCCTAGIRYFFLESSIFQGWQKIRKQIFVINRLLRQTHVYLSSLSVKLLSLLSIEYRGWPSIVFLPVLSPRQCGSLPLQ